MKPDEFRHKWADNELKERSASQEHFIDLCRMLGQPTPAEVDKTGESYCFEKGALKTDGSDGWADVWKKGFFAWEYKGRHANLLKAYGQLLDYREALGNPPLLVVCDRDRIEVHTNFTNTDSQVHTVRLAEIGHPESLRVLRALFSHPESLRPGVTAEGVTEQAAAQVGALAERLRARGVPAHDAAHFLMKLIFCLFAEDVGLLPRGIMERLLSAAREDSARFDSMVAGLLQAMRTGGYFGAEEIDHFNGGLFDDEATIALQPDEIKALARVAKLEWDRVDPSVFGTLFERSLDPSKRAQLGAHYTSKTDIEAIVEPVLMEPLRREWDEVRGQCEGLWAQVGEIKRVTGQPQEISRNQQKRSKLLGEIESAVHAFRNRLAAVRVLDPACGSGNFLYVSLNALMDLDAEVSRHTVGWNLTAGASQVHPRQLRGLEIDPYAAELAQLTVWIGYLQWNQRHATLTQERPILEALETIERRDAIVEVGAEGVAREPEWPKCDVIVGNPPFLGDKKLRGELGDGYVGALFGLYGERVPNQSDLCCYWFERARTEIVAGRAKRAGLLATNSIRQGKNRVVLERILGSGGIFMAWSDREWILDGAAVRVSMVGFDDGGQVERALNGDPVTRINPDLTAGADLTSAVRLRANAGVSFMGGIKGGAFDIPGDLARRMLALPNPLGRSNADVVRPWVNGLDVTRRPRDMWIIDFGDMPIEQAALYETPFEYVRANVYPERSTNRRTTRRERWWVHAEVHPAMRAAIGRLPRYVGTVIVAAHRLFVWLPVEVVPDHRLIVFAREDDYFFGVVHSRVHEVWSLATCSWQGKGNDPVYTPQTCFETFPFPVPTDEQRAAISEAAKRLHEVRQSALDGDPKLTLTALYNKRPTWLDNLHRDLDAAVLAAYGWPADLSDEGLLERLLALNLERAEDEKRGVLVRP